MIKTKENTENNNLIFWHIAKSFSKVCDFDQIFSIISLKKLPNLSNNSIICYIYITYLKVIETQTKNYS